MQAFKSPALAALAAAVAVLAVPDVASANGFHFGAGTHLPAVAVFGFGLFVVVVVLFFLANWARYRRVQSRTGPSLGPGSSPTWEEEEDNDIG